MKRSLTDELWRLGTLAELPRDMHCTHGSTDKDGTGPAPCPECRQVAEVLEALRNERPS